MQKREEQKEKRRMDILFVGLDLFVQKGYAATKISDISTAANMSTGLLFHYFESKEKLYIELVKMGLQGTQMAMQLTFDEPLDFFEQSINLIFTNIKDQPIMAKMFVLMAQAQRNDGVPETVRQIATQVNNIEQTVELIKKGQDNNTIRQGNPLALANAFWCSIQGIAEQLASNPDIPFPETEWIVDIIRNKGE